MLHALHNGFEVFSCRSVFGKKGPMKTELDLFHDYYVCPVKTQPHPVTIWEQLCTQSGTELSMESAWTP